MENVKNITVFSSPDCAYCYTLKGYLDSKGIKYTEVDIYADDAGREKMEKLSGQNSVPVTLVDDKVLVGWDKGKLNEFLELQ